MNKGSIFLTGLLAGAATGLVAGMLLAPKPGKDTRELIIKEAENIRERAEGYVDNVRARFQRNDEEETA